MVLKWEPVMKDVISEVIETMFFSVVEFQDCERVDRSFDFESEIELRNHDGRMVISMQLSEEFARMITAGFLGIEEHQVKDEDLLDTIKELTNIVGGGYHARIDDVGWQLGIPVVWKAGASNATQVAQGTVRLDFSFFEEPAGSAALSYLPA